ncbi:hypothetical protein CK203_006236 [Vitis vinifera]|uniref:Uncharacterized protein n=1 Tax=Vitis vinifera TaxID=29760 RepID=A0A438K5P9_VITVI|nr:hypothetical protein CK203_006236 [Vitis vinifera]
MHLCPGRDGRAEIVPWSLLVWVRHVSDVYRRVTFTKVFCQATCRFETFWDSFGRFLSPRLSLLSPLSLCILQSQVAAIALPHSSFSSTALAFCTTATPVAIHLFYDSATFPSFGLGGLSFYQQCSSEPYCGIQNVEHFGYFLGRATAAGDRERHLDGVCPSYLTHHFSMSSRGGADFTCETSKEKKNVQPREDIGQTNEEKLIKLLTARNNEQFNVRLRFPLPSLFKRFLYFTKIPPTFLHPNAVMILMGCSILNMLYHLDLSLLEVLFVYTVKMSQKEVFSLFAHILSLQLMTGLPDSTKSVTKGQVVVSGPWASSYEHLAHAFELCRSLGISGKMRRCRLVKWVNKTSFDRLNKLYMISTGEQNHETLLTDQNLLALVRDSELYVVPTLPCFVPRMLILDLHFYAEARATDTKARQDWLEKREKKC